MRGGLGWGVSLAIFDRPGVGLEAVKRGHPPKDLLAVMTTSLVTSVIASEAKQSRAGEPKPTQIASSLALLVMTPDAPHAAAYAAIGASTFSTGFMLLIGSDHRGRARGRVDT